MVIISGTSRLQPSDHVKTQPSFIGGRVSLKKVVYRYFFAVQILDNMECAKLLDCLNDKKRTETQNISIDVPPTVLLQPTSNLIHSPFWFVEHPRGISLTLLRVLKPDFVL